MKAKKQHLPNPSPAPVIRSGRRLYRLLAEVAPYGVGVPHRPAKHGETRTQAMRNGTFVRYPEPELKRVVLERTRRDRQLLRAWQTLKCLPPNRCDWIGSLWSVLENTCPAESAQVLEPLPPLRQGVDLTPWLSDRDAVAELIERVNPAGSAIDPWVWARWGEAVDVRNSAFESWFAASLLPFVRAGGVAIAEDLAEAAEEFGVRKRPVSMALVASLLEQMPPQSALRWLRFLAEEEAERGERLLWQLVTTKGAEKVECDRALVSALRSWRHLPAHEEGVARELPELSLLLKALLEGASPAYVLSALRLGREHQLALPRRVYAGSAPLPNCIVDFANTHASPWVARRLWEACGRLDGFRELLAEIEPHRAQPDEVLAWLELLLDFEGEWHRSNPGSGSKNWCGFVRIGGELWRRYLACKPKHRESMIDYFGVVRASKALCKSLPCREEFLSLGERLVAANGKGGLAADVVFYLWVFGRLEVADLAKRIPDSAWAKLAKACTSTNRGNLLEHGFFRMTRADGRMAVEAFTFFPARMIEVARVCGTPGKRVANAAAKVYAEHPLAHLDLHELPLRDAATLVDAVARFRPMPGVPKALLEHLDGGSPLRPDRLKHYTEELFQNGARLKLEVYSELLETEINRALVGQGNADLPLHTVLIAQNIDDNERAMRRYLRERVHERRDGRLSHPNNQRWITSHQPDFDMDAWLGQLEGTTRLDGRGEVTFRLESDPDEVLKLGSYVGSCLGLGGDFSYAAVGALLDANKRVIYARNERGRVLGRQLVAVSKAVTLVCFDVYGSASESLEPGFAGFDRTLAECCGLEIDRGDEYEIERLLIREWYDDGAWDLRVGA